MAGRSARRGPGGPGRFGPSQPGQILSPFLQARLQLTDAQKKQLAALQKEVDSRLEKLLTNDQKKQLKEVREMFSRGGPGGFPGFGPKGPGGPGGPGGFPGFGPPGGGGVFRTSRYAANYPGLAGRTLTPGATIEELERKGAK